MPQSQRRTLKWQQAGMLVWDRSPDPPRFLRSRRFASSGFTSRAMWRIAWDFIWENSTVERLAVCGAWAPLGALGRARALGGFPAGFCVHSIPAGNGVGANERAHTFHGLREWHGTRVRDGPWIEALIQHHAPNLAH